MITWIRELLLVPRVLVQTLQLSMELSVQLHDLQRLMQEQNGLLRELVTAHTHQAAATPPIMLERSSLNPSIANLEAKWRRAPVSFSTRRVYTGQPATASDVSTPETRAAREQATAIEAEKRKNL